MQALKEVCHQHPDFIFLDAIMPGIDGSTASTIIRDYEADVGYRASVVGSQTRAVNFSASRSGCQNRNFKVLIF